jgi:tRNA threonylcarbamoyladenosine biosynthesis protein TsaE
MKRGWKGGCTTNPSETMKLGTEMSNFLENGDILSLTGELASGKTTFVKGILKGFNYEEEVTSPTFTLINEYHVEFPIIHIDAYRENDLNRWIKVGFRDYLNNENIVIIEWADKIFSLLPEDSIKLSFSHEGQNKRKIKLL